MKTYFALGDIIEMLKRYPPEQRVPLGLGEPMSYRGYYDQLAFAPAYDTTVGEMLAHAESALGETFTGYKGGEFTMEEYTECWLAEYGEGGGQAIGEVLLRYMLGDTAVDASAGGQPVTPSDRVGTPDTIAGVPVKDTLAPLPEEYR